VGFSAIRIPQEQKLNGERAEGECQGTPQEAEHRFSPRFGELCALYSENAPGVRTIGVGIGIGIETGCATDSDSDTDTDAEAQVEKRRSLMCTWCDPGA
jgi:hypothetical protein